MDSVISQLIYELKNCKIPNPKRVVMVKHPYTQDGKQQFKEMLEWLAQAELGPYWYLMKYGYHDRVPFTVPLSDMFAMNSNYGYHTIIAFSTTGASLMLKMALNLDITDITDRYRDDWHPLQEC